MARAHPGLGFHHGTGRLKVLGLQAPPGVGTQFPYKESLGLVVPNIIIPLVPPGTVGLAQLLPAISGVDGAAKLFGIDKGFRHQHRVAILGLPVAA